jgi:hypothetical protein
VGKRVKGNTGKAKATKRVIKQPDTGTPSDRYLVWRFGRLDHEGQFGCQNLPATDARGLEAEFAIFQKETISSLLHKRWLKFIDVDEMTPDGQEGLSKVNEQENGLWQLHLQRHKWRVWGYFEDPEFFFLWWDGHHGVATGHSRHRKT